MEKTFIISDYSEKLKRIINSLALPESNVIANESHESERKYHGWLLKTFQEKEIDKIIIPLSLTKDAQMSNSDGFMLALHIRLNYELDIEKRLVPIIFLTNFTVDNILTTYDFDIDNNPQNIIFTKGIYFSSFDTEEIKAIHDEAIVCTLSEYQSKILSKLNIHRKATSGGHDIANAWGCFKLAQVVGLRDEIFELETISKHLKQLYAKFLICKNDSFSDEETINLEPINCQNKQILFIDDKADEGWEDLMKGVFKGDKNNFVCVDSSKYKAKDNHREFTDFEGFYKECKSHIGKEWDLIIIDLRLHPKKEDIDKETINPKSLSGYKLIDEFLNSNEGYQIIVSTASNKIWNINAALERGAYSYYIKEAPEFNFTLNQSKTHYFNFKQNVEKCFQRKHLREIYTHWLNAKHKNTNKVKNFIEESNAALDIAWELIKNDQLNFGYLTLFQSIEGLANKLYKSNDTMGSITTIEKEDGKPDKWILTFVSDKNNGSYFKNGKEPKEEKRNPETLFKISCLFKIIYRKDDDFLKKFGALNKLRNDIAHPASSPLKQLVIDSIIIILEILNEVREK